MQYRLKRSLTGLLVLAMVFTLTIAPTLAQGISLVRFVHAIPGASAVDIYTDGQLTISGLGYGQATGYVQMVGGTHQIMVTQAGATSPIWEQAINPAANSAITLVAASTNPLNFLAFTDNIDPLPVGKARLTAVHAINGVESADLVLSDGRPVIPGLQFGQQVGTLDIPAMTYDMVIVPPGESTTNALLTPSTLALDSGISYTLLAYGTSDNPVSMLLTASASPEVAGGYLRLGHALPGTAAVDIYLNDVLVAPGLNFGGTTNFLPVPAGSYEVAVSPSGSTDKLITATVNVNNGVYQTAVAVNDGTAPTLSVSNDDISGVDAQTAVANLINLTSGTSTGAIALGDGTVLASDITSGTSSLASTVPSMMPLQASVTIGNTTVTGILTNRVYGGVYYTALAVGEELPQVILFTPVSLAQSVASAPTTAAVVAAAVPTTAPVEVAPPPTQAAPVIPTPLPVTAPTVQTDLPTGRVYNLDADRNLQLRQYPNADALSLGTVPPNTVLIVNGREGAYEDIPNSAYPLQSGYTFTDPASLLPDDKSDLDPAATWLNVTYDTPDGGAITAWVNALYLDVRDKNNERVRLADLQTVPGNLPGASVSTEVTPPPIPEDRVTATVFNLDPSVNLNLRRTPTVDGEVLTRQPNGTVTEFLGVNAAQDWYFVRYTPAEGGSITGWASALYLQLRYKGNLVDLEELQSRGLLVELGDDTRGAIEGGASQAPIPTADPVKDQVVAQIVTPGGDNLHLRRNADNVSESIALIPNGSLLIVGARSGNGEWLQVTFEGQVGWISSGFVRLTFNGRAFDLAEVPVETGVVDQGVVATAVPNEPLPSDVNDSLINERLPIVINDPLVQLTGSPGGSADGLPIAVKDQAGFRLFTDGTFAYIELLDGTRGWVPAGSIRPS
ncbi:MAG: DUF4397 domain-containing protein [Anaerolineaceae bacterium]|nr:DUF4397 domain-containing protein [Anaerolineaceae bacterium]